MKEATLAPELAAGLEWINAPALRLHEQRGRVVLLAFWSAGSIYCHNLLDELRALHGKYADGLSVIGVHTPKFDAERDPRRVLKAVNRLALRFPVAHDPDFITWQHYGIRAWPSVAVIDPQGRLVEISSGDLKRDALDALIARLLDAAGDADQRIYELAPAALRPEPRLPLNFPGGIAVTQNHLYIADSGHHRVLECSHEGRVLRQFGAGSAGFVDGGSAECNFQFPRGLAVLKDVLYVADTGNHAIRRVRLLNGDVDTVAGTGKPGVPDGVQPGDAAATALNAPWDLAGSYDKLYIAMTGLQQIWELDLGKRTVRAIAGAGRLGLADGSGSGAAFAQPAGLALVQQTLYVADASASAIRSLQLGSGTVQTLVGHAMFEFGDQDGSRATARLQYPLALALDSKSPLLWIADSYNDALKTLRLGGGDVRRHALDYSLREPSAIAAGPGALWVANTGAHEVLRIDLDSNSVRRLPVGE